MKKEKEKEKEKKKESNKYNINFQNIHCRMYENEYPRKSNIVYVTQLLLFHI
jgi:hypothetical protein